MRKHLYFLQQISPGFERKLWKDLSAKWKNSMQTWAVSVMGETPGNPVWFSRKYLPDLRALSGDQGGRKILKKHPEEIRWYPVAHAKELEDVDYNFDNNLIVPDGAC